MEKKTTFKSYYVVWKRNAKTKYKIRHTEFKSYYVVWKQRVRTFKFFQDMSLNRTMQYGNRK